MSEIKVEVTLGQFSLKLVGSSDTVVDLFRELRDSGLGDLIAGLPLGMREDTITPSLQEFNWTQQERVDESVSESAEVTLRDAEWPSFETAIMQGRPKSHAEWLLVSAAYAAMEVSQPTTDQVVKDYLARTKHFDSSAKKNYSNNIKRLVNRGEIEVLTGGEYIITEKGREQARKILERPERASAARRKSAKAKTPKYKMISLELSEDQRDEFRSYLNSMDYSSVVEKALAVAGWLKDVLNIEEVTEDHIFTMLRIAEESISFNLFTALTNGKSRYGYYVAGNQPNTFAITHVGEDHLKKLPKHE